MLNDIEQRIEQLQIADADVAPLAWQALCNALKLVLG